MGNPLSTHAEASTKLITAHQAHHCDDHARSQNRDKVSLLKHRDFTGWKDHCTRVNDDSAFRWVLFRTLSNTSPILPGLWRRASDVNSSKASARQPSFYLRAGGLLQLFLGPELVGVAALFLAAVLGARRQTGIADSADLLVLVILLRKHHQRRFNDAATQAQHQVKGRLCWAWGASALDRGWQAPLRRALVRHACRSPGPDQPTRGPLTLRCLHAHSCVLLSASHCLQANEPGSAAGRRVSPRQSAIPACLRI